MDQIIENKKMPLKKGLVIVGAISVLALLLLSLTRRFDDGKILKVDAVDMRFASVVEGQFDDSISIRTKVDSREVLYIDAIEGGRVESIDVEDGDVVEEGKVLLEIVNPAVQLDVIRSNAETAQQLNNIRSLELDLERNRLAHKRNIMEVDYNIAMLERDLRRTRKLVVNGAVNQVQLEDLEFEYKWSKERRKLLVESQKTDAVMQEKQMKQLALASMELEINQKAAQKNLDNLIVRAPKAGRLTGFHFKVGQSVGSGSRIGQIDEEGRYKLVAEIDEFYLGRVILGQTVKINHQNGEITLRVDKIYPQVVDNKFSIDLAFVEEPPADLRRGQTINGQLFLGESKKSLLLENGAFYQGSAGKWVFVVSDGKSEARKKDVKMGRRNADYIEVLDGLAPGEKVVVSSYSDYTNVDILRY